MASQIPSNPQSLYRPIDTTGDIDGLVPSAPAAEEPAFDETLLSIPGAMLHLIDKHGSIELAAGDFSLHRLTVGPAALALLASVDSVQWPVTRDTAAVKLDSSHYFFALGVPDADQEDDNKNKTDQEEQNSRTKNGNILLNYGLTFATEGQVSSLAELDQVLESCCGFSVQKVNEALDESLVKHIAEAGPKEEEMMEVRSAAYWTTLAPNVEDYSGMVAKGIAMGSGHVVKGIIWCGDVTVERLKWGNEFLKKRMAPGEKAEEISPETLKRIKR